jgi:hypothetical protein
MMRSVLLTHWTGKDVCMDPRLLNTDLRARYLERLRSTLRERLWMTVPHERLIGHAGPKHPARIEYHTPMTCFTELRLSQSAPHWARYGLLGFVVSRMFVLERAGGPVQYLRCHLDEPLVGNLVIVFDWLNEQIKAGLPRATDVWRALFFQTGFFKAMSNENLDDFAYLDELEWRIVHTDHQTRDGRIVATGQQLPPYRIPLKPEDVQMLIVPDAHVRADAMPELQMWAGSRLPPVLTVEEVQHM